jgi:hypothetical protein
MRVIHRNNLPPELIAQIDAKISRQRTLKDVMNWALTEPGSFLPQIVGEVVIQDEFTHDVIVPWRDELVLVYDTT